MLKTKIHEAVGDFIGLIYPKICMACEDKLMKHEEHLCTSCIYSLPKTNYHLQADNEVSKLFWGRLPIEAGAAMLYFDKGGKVQRLMHRFKYKGFKEIGWKIGELYGRELKDCEPFNTANAIIPVPLHRRKKRKRGYNQSEYFASGLSEVMEIPVDFTSLTREKSTETQTKKTRYERYENMLNSFKLTQKDQIEGKHILLVDDVITTGATLEACAQKLRSADGVKVSVLTIACAR